MRVGLLTISIVALCIWGCQPTRKEINSQQTPPLASLAQMAARAGFRVFDFPRDTFKPGTITQVDSGGNIVRTPAGSLQECQKVPMGKGNELSLKVHRGRGPSGNFEALDTSGAQVDLQMLEQILPVHFGATARSAAYVVMKVPATSSRERKGVGSLNFAQEKTPDPFSLSGGSGHDRRGLQQRGVDGEAWAIFYRNRGDPVKKKTPDPFSFPQICQLP